MSGAARGDDHNENELLRELFEAPFRPEWVRSNLLRASEVAALFQVSSRTVSEWAQAGKLPYLTTPGGQRRFPVAAVAELIASAASPARR